MHGKQALETISEFTLFCDMGLGRLVAFRNHLLLAFKRENMQLYHQWI
jgi:hypothetical protein